MKKILILLFMMGLLVSLELVSGFGIAPSSRNIVLESDEEFSIHIINRDKEAKEVEIVVEGPLKDYITLDRDTAIFAHGQERETITVFVEEHEDQEKGEQENRIRFIQKSQRERGEISAQLELSFVLNIRKPYDESFINLELLAPNFERGKENRFIIKAENQGLENALNVKPIIDIYTRTNDKIDTITLDPIRLSAGEKQEFFVPYTPTFRSSQYYAEVSVVYEGESNTQIKQFNVGKPEINIDTISTNEFRLGGIANFNLILESEWGETIRNVYAEVDFKKDNSLLERTRSHNTDIRGYQRSALPIYWDTSGLNPGTYDMEITLNYLDKTKERTYEVEVASNQLNVLGTGFVAAAETDEEFDYTPFLVLAIFLLVATNTYFVYYLLNKRKK